MNEALILACLLGGSNATVADVAERLDGDDFGRRIDDGSIYIALQRMTERGYLTAGKARVISADGRPRDVGIYRITGEGARALEQFAHEAMAVQRLRASFGGA